MQSIEVAQRYAKAFNSHDIEAVRAVFDSKAKYTDPVVAQGVDNEGLGVYVSGLLRSIPDLRFDVLKLVPAGDDAVVMEWIMRGTNTGPLEQGPATNRSISLPGVDVIEVKNSRITSLRAYFDRMAYAEQLGLIPPPAQV